MKEKNIIYSEVFWAGYRAFVLGGKKPIYNRSGCVVDATGGIEPPECLNEAQKQQWRNGVQYAIAERKDCRKRDDADREQVLFDFYKDNGDAKEMTHAQLAEKLGVSNAWIRKNRCRFKLKYNARPRCKFAGKEEELEQLFKTGDAKDMTQAQLAKKLGVSPAWVQQTAHKLGLLSDSKQRRASLRDRLKRLYESGVHYSFNQLAEKLGVSPTWVRLVVRDLGLHHDFRKHKYDDVERKLEILLKSSKDFSAREIARRLSMSISWVKSHMKMIREGGQQ